MASRLFSSNISSGSSFLFSPVTLGLTFTTTYFAHCLIRGGNYNLPSSMVVRCDADTRQLYSSSTLGSSSVSAADWSYSKNDEYQGRTAQKPSGMKQDTRRREAKLYRQISSGSIIGLIAGVAVGTFSKPLAFLFGLLLFGVQFAASRGLHVIPYGTIQRYVKSVDVRSLLTSHAPFKLSLGLTFALAALVPL